LGSTEKSVPAGNRFPLQPIDSLHASVYGKPMSKPTTPTIVKVCRRCGEIYERTYEEHTGSEKHREAIWKAVGRSGEPPIPVA
jgi:hypothetical protein